VVLPAGAAHAQDTGSPSPLSAEALRALEAIRRQDIVAHARFLSDPVYRGREAGTKGVRKAATCIAEEFRRYGLLPGGSAGSFFQPFKLRTGYDMTSECQASIGSQTLGELKRGEDYMPIHLPGGAVDVTAECVLVGYGITLEPLSFDEYAGIDAKGKAVIAFSGVPWGRQAGGWIGKATDRASLGMIAYKARNAAAHGAVLLLIVDNPAGWRDEVRVPERLRVPDMAYPLDSPIPVAHVTREFVARLTTLSSNELRLLAADIAGERAPQSMPLRERRVRLKAVVTGAAVIGRNVVAVLPGRDDILKREAVVIGAHYDHLGEGRGSIYFGANDNAAGVGALLAVARAFGSLPRAARRTLVFVAFDAEEIGRLGSRHYVSRPCVPMAQTVLMINYDMIGRNEPDHIYAVGTRSSPELHTIHQDVNRYVGLRLTHPESFRLGRSDHSPFYYAGVPILYLFGGLDSDYNTPRDTWDKLIPAKMEKVARLAFLTAYTVANREARLSFQDMPARSATHPLDMRPKP
jgi:hypothetical protein